MLLSLLFSCAEPGKPGEEDCLPELYSNGCTVWRCWHVYDDGVVGYTFGAGWDDDYGFAILSDECLGPKQCCEYQRNAAIKGCGLEDPGPNYCDALR